MNPKRKIAIFTGNRAEYGLQYPILKAIDEHPDLEYQLLVSGAHLDSSFGNTLKEIEKDGFKISAEVKIDMNADSHLATAEAIGTGVLSMTQVLDQLKPDVVVVYADRFEGFAATIASSQMNIPTAHIEGGDLTEGGALDDSVRHAMSKLSHVHFTTNQQASNRLLAMGEEPWRIHTVGLPALDVIGEGNYASPDEVEQRLGITTDQPIILFTQHSVTTEFENSANQIKQSLTALKNLAAKGCQVVITYPNNDAGGRMIIDSIKQLDSENLDNIQVRKSLGRHLYHGVLALANNRNNKVVCAGNSSSGVKETAVFGCPTVNIGSRQAGRLRGSNVLSVDYDSHEIEQTIEKCLNDDDFRKTCAETDNPYYIGAAGKKIAQVLADLSLDKKLIRKQMLLQGEAKDGWFR